jgi:hypothetical protein
LGGISIDRAHDVAQTLIPRLPRGRQATGAVQLSHLLHAREIVLFETRAMARQAAFRRVMMGPATYW